MLKLQKADRDALRRHGEQTYPRECCGVLLGVTTGDLREVRATVRCGNTRDDSPENRYQIDPREIIRIQREARQQNLEIVGFYHSHPDHPARWSAIDFEEAHWIGCSYLITSVVQGKATATCSFALTGTREEDKALVEEEIVLD